MTSFLVVKAVNGRTPSLQEAAAQLNVPLEILDVEYGVYVVDERMNLYVVKTVITELIERDDVSLDLGLGISEP
jgi:hypothetical protein